MSRCSGFSVFGSTHLEDHVTLCKKNNKTWTYSINLEITTFFYHLFLVDIRIIKEGVWEIQTEPKPLSNFTSRVKGQTDQPCCCYYRPQNVMPAPQWDVHMSLRQRDSSLVFGPQRGDPWGMSIAGSHAPTHTFREFSFLSHSSLSLSGLLFLSLCFFYVPNGQIFYLISFFWMYNLTTNCSCISYPRLLLQQIDHSVGARLGLFPTCTYGLTVSQTFTIHSELHLCDLQEYKNYSWRS